MGDCYFNYFYFTIAVIVNCMSIKNQEFNQNQSSNFTIFTNSAIKHFPPANITMINYFNHYFANLLKKWSII